MDNIFEIKNPSDDKSERARDAAQALQPTYDHLKLAIDAALELPQYAKVKCKDSDLRISCLPLFG